MKKQFTIIFCTCIAIAITACSQRGEQASIMSDSEGNNDSIVTASEETLIQSSNSQSLSNSGTLDNVREANVPSELIGAPDRIYIVKDKKERIIEPNTDEYSEILEILRERFPEKLKEAAQAILWADESGFNWDIMCDQFDFLQLSYDTAQTVKLNCMIKDDYPLKEISFDIMVFPLSEHTGTVSIDTHKTSEFVGRSYGPLDKSSDIVAELLEYMG